MHSNQLCLNSDMTEVIWVSTSRQQHQLCVLPMPINGLLVRIVQNLGVLIDADLVMRSHVTRVVAQCFAVLHHLRLIGQMPSPSTLKTVVIALVLSRLDYVELGRLKTVVIALVLSRLDYANRGSWHICIES